MVLMFDFGNTSAAMTESVHVLGLTRKSLVDDAHYQKAWLALHFHAIHMFSRGMAMAGWMTFEYNEGTITVTKSKPGKVKEVLYCKAVEAEVAKT